MESCWKSGKKIFERLPEYISEFAGEIPWKNREGIVRIPEGLPGRTIEGFTWYSFPCRILQEISGGISGGMPERTSGRLSGF